MRGPILVLLALVILPAGLLQAQRLTPEQFPRVTDDPVTPTPNRSTTVGGHTTDPALLVIGGVIGGAAGLLAGGLVGARATEHRCEDCGFVGGVYGAVAGGSVGLPLGVHVANGRRGRVLPALGASLAIGGAGLGLAALTNDARVMITVPVLQILTSIMLERSTSRR